MHSKWRYKICICSFILGEESFRNCKGFSFIIPKSLEFTVLPFYESENFSDSPLRHFVKSENIRFPFATKNSLTWGVKSEKMNLRKSEDIY